MNNDNYIKDFLKEYGMSQKHFASELGVTNITINNWISNRTSPPKAMKIRIIKYIQNFRRND